MSRSAWGRQLPWVCAEMVARVKFRDVSRPITWEYWRDYGVQYLDEIISDIKAVCTGHDWNWCVCERS